MLQLKTIKLFALDLVDATTEATVDALLRPGARRTAVFLNAHCCNVAAKDETYRWAINRADYRLPDGSGVQLAAKMLGRRFTANLNGTDLFVPICNAAAAKGLSIFFFGSANGIARRAADKACKIAPALSIAGVRHGFFAVDEEQQIIDEINASGADVVLIALGVPKQDVWIARNRHRLDARLVLGVGAQFDFWSGRVPRAPLFLRTAGVEWLMRLAIEPKRMARRYLVGNLEFVLRSLLQQRLSPRGASAQMRGKRLLDVALSSLAIVALSPLFALIAIAIRMESAGPAFFLQTRVGAHGVPFTIIKFRSMFADSEARREALLATSDRAGVCFKSREDPRKTRVGNFLRRFSLDELPQLFNVWAGDMTMVGPRPALLQEVAVYPAAAMKRFDAKPGITGLWQVSGRAEIGFDKMIEMDTAYANGRTLLLDIAIIALTLRAVVSGRGAY